MRNFFTKLDAQISIEHRDDSIRLSVSSDYSGSNRKSKLYINENRISTEVGAFWKSIKSKKLKDLTVGFGEIDWHDNHTDMYEVPCFFIKRGLRKAKVSHRDHGSIPKDWSIDLSASFTPTSAIGPFMEVIDGTIGRFLDVNERKELIKKIRPVLQGKEKHASFHKENPED